MQPTRHRLLSLFLVAAMFPFGAAARAPMSQHAPVHVSQSSNDFNDAFEAMMADPANVDKTIRYSKAAVSAGDYESAIPPLEKLLIMNPAQPQVRLEVGVLYYLLNSHDMARDYLTNVKDDATARTADRERASSYLARL